MHAFHAAAPDRQPSPTYQPKQAPKETDILHMKDVAFLFRTNASKERKYIAKYESMARRRQTIAGSGNNACFVPNPEKDLA